MKVQKGIYILLALLLGGIGVHKFYAGKWIVGILYLLFSWTWIPVFVSLFDLLFAAFQKPDQFGQIRV